MSNSYTSGPQSRSLYNRSISIIDEEYVAPELDQGPPSIPSVGMNSNPSLQEYKYGAREVLSERDESYLADGLSKVRPFQSSLTDMENRRLHQTSSKAPGFDGVIHENGSKNIFSGGDQYGDIKAPGVSDLGRENHSNPSGGDQTSSAGGEINQADYVGISLVGKKFKEVNPTAYYVEKDDDLNGFK